jgi:signal peptidase I
VERDRSDGGSDYDVAMSTLPGVARAACVVAFLMALGIALEATMGPIVLLPAALVPVCSAGGIIRRRVWSAWGFAIYLFAQLAILPVIQFRAGGSAVEWVSIGITAVFTIAIGILFIFAGHSLATAGAARGWAAPWIIISALVTLPWLFVQAFVIPTGAMEDTLLVGDRILVQRFPRSVPALGEMMALVYPVDRRQTFIKRIVGMPGDRIRISNKVLFRNGVQLNEPYAVHRMDSIDSYRDNFPGEPDTAVYPQGREMLSNHVANGEVVVPPGKYFVMGDNRDQSLDSRYWGFVNAGDFIGRPVMVYDSADQTTEQLAGGRTPFHFSRTRWNRLFKVL